jgi:superfamily II RNA helicase
VAITPLLLNDFLNQLKFQLDDFQLEAVQEIDQGHSVVVCAPTGSGKTVIAEFAANKAINDGKKLFYTTPLKALSNQKYFDFKAQFGDQNVGLLTGDLSFNRDARIVVMTTEVFRNMLYGVREDSSLLANVGYVVLDECHFMNDADRGTVWEESIIYCPLTTQIIALSATVANAQELTDWIHHVHPQAKLISSDFRPVPLRFSYYDRIELLPLFEAPGKVNKQIKIESRPPLPKGVKPGARRGGPKPRPFKPNLLIEAMAAKDMLPGIFFTFSRMGCDQALRDTKGLNLLTHDEKVVLRQKMDDFIVQNPFLADDPMLELIANGFASHHAGLLPGVKMLVETLFQQGLIKAVFATETLAAGINMPARSTVITSISKRGNEGHRILKASEFLQMAGRAGRRGMDTIGYVVIVSSAFRGPKEAGILATAPPEPLTSQFTCTYGMVLNLLQKSSLSEVGFLIRKSFGQFTSERRLKPLVKDIDTKAAELDHYMQFECPHGLNDEGFNAFLKQKETLAQAHRTVHTLKKQVGKHGHSIEVEAALLDETGHKDDLKHTVEGSPCYKCDLLHLHGKNEHMIRQLQKYLKSLNTVYDREKDLYWKNFLNLYHLLKHIGYFEEPIEDFPKPTPKGNLTAQIRAENELYLAQLILGKAWDGLEPAQLAAVVSCVVSDSIRESQFSNCPPSPQVVETLNTMLDYEIKLNKLQEKFNVVMPVHLNPLPAGLVEAWAQGLPWDKLIESTNIDQGGLVRILRRTCDLLRQFSRIPEIPNELSQLARQALKLVYKDPIKELDMLEEVFTDVPVVEEPTALLLSPPVKKEVKPRKPKAEALSGEALLHQQGLAILQQFTD